MGLSNITCVLQCSADSLGLCLSVVVSTRFKYQPRKFYLLLLWHILPTNPKQIWMSVFPKHNIEFKVRVDTILLSHGSWRKLLPAHLSPHRENSRSAVRKSCEHNFSHHFPTSLLENQTEVINLNGIISKEDCRVPEISGYTYAPKRVINVSVLDGSWLSPQQWRAGYRLFTHA